MRFSDTETTILMALNSFMTSLFFVNFVFIIHNLYKYIYGLKIYRPLIVIFYMLITLSTICRISEFVCRAVDPEHSYFAS